LQRVQNLPGVVAATETSKLPPYGDIRSEIEIAGKTHSERWDAIYQLLRGRILSAVEVNDGRKVAVVNQTLVKKYFGFKACSAEGGGGA
jgi:hypothetical protein